MGKRIILLDEACRDFGGRGEVARALGVSPGMVGHWITGRCRVTAESAMILTDLFEDRFGPDEICPDARWDVAHRVYSRRPVRAVLRPPKPFRR